ncbi:MAG TPA: TfoX/Sxy family protein [Burkholderiaceae bacterium]|nr:TfoX/Sxy family protein [Burkholderiaceae bacterium]
MSTPLVDHCLELFAPLGAVRARRMFGGHGFYIDDLFVAIVAAERLYLKTDAQTRPAFEQAGGEPFVYDAKKGSVALGYWTVPADAMESPALMQPWARQAIAAALRARAAKPSAAPRRARAAASKAAPTRRRGQA